MVDYKKAIKDRNKDIKSKCSICKKPYEFIKTENKMQFKKTEIKTKTETIKTTACMNLTCCFFLYSNE